MAPVGCTIRRRLDDNQHGFRLRMARVVALVVTVLALVWLAAPAGAQGPKPPTLARIPFTDRAALEQLVETYDVWEINYQDSYALVALDPDRVETLKKAGVAVVVNPADALAHPMDAYPACYLTVDGLYNAMNQLVTDYPALVTLEDFGGSWLRLHPDQRGNGHRLYALMLGNRAKPDPRPTFFLMANIHARELATPELALAFARNLLQGYGVDADATWLLDHQRTVVILTANPDGHRVAEQGYLQRKNANNTFGPCSNPPTEASQIGVDLNRNHSFRWGEVGSSPFACSLIYRGEGPASEVETQTIQEFASALIPSRRATDTTMMPVDTPNLLVSLHSYGRWVLWPWGFSQTSAPETALLSRLGQRFTDFNGYTPGQSSITLYDTSGDTTDWAYGTLGIPAYTFEIGTSFFQPCEDVQGILDANIPALRYAARVARAPYSQAQGPRISNIPPSLGAYNAGAFVEVNILADATTAASALVGAAEMKLNTPDWEPGTGIPMLAVDGLYNEPTEDARGIINTTGLTPGRHLVYIRGRDNQGHWGPIWATWLTINGSVDMAITGQVKDQNNMPIPNGRVVLAPGGATTTTGPNGAFTVSAPPGSYTVKAYANGYTPGQTNSSAPATNVSLQLTKLPCILLVDGDTSGVALASWTGALDALAASYSYSVWRVNQQGSPRLNTLREYGIVIWIGGENGALTDAQQTALQAYLEAGGHLLVSGQRLALGQPPTATFYTRDLSRVQVSGGLTTLTNGLGYFFTHDLHLTAPQSKVGTGVNGADLLSGVSASLSGADRVSYAQPPTSMSPNLGSATILRYAPDNSPAAIAYADTTRRLVVLGFGLETVAGAASRQGLLQPMLRWLGCPGGCALDADVNRDGTVNTADAQLVASSWLRSTGDPSYIRHHDIDSSGRIDVVDITRITRAWGQVCP